MASESFTLSQTARNNFRRSRSERGLFLQNLHKGSKRGGGGKVYWGGRVQPKFWGCGFCQLSCINFCSCFVSYKLNETSFVPEGSLKAFKSSRIFLLRTGLENLIISRELNRKVEWMSEMTTCGLKLVCRLMVDSLISWQLANNFKSHKSSNEPQFYQKQEKKNLKLQCVRFNFTHNLCKQNSSNRELIT